ncbi:hypothetical protein [Polaribacter marinus]|nr:hypothetical protein [Polaribacter marinus]
MKKYIYIMVIGLMLSACADSENTNTVISVLEDMTETDFVAIPDAKEIITQFGYEKNLWSSATFRYGRINSLIHNSRDLISLGQEKALLGNELERRRLVANFNKDVEDILNKPKDSSTYNHSSIWLPIVEELKVLQKDSISKCKLYVFSDLQENTRWFSVFRVADIHLLESQRDALVKMFLGKSQGIMPSKFIEVIVVYQPKTIAEDELFQKLKQLYVQLFSSLGISIKFTANLNSKI